MVPELAWTGSEFLWRNAAHFSTDAQHYARQYLARLERYRPLGQFRGSPVYSLYQPPPATEPGRRALATRLRRKFEGVRIPATATIAVNKACQCDCEHCSAAEYNTSAGAPLSLSALRQALTETLDLGVTHIILLGGEPLLRKDLTQVISSVDVRRATVILFTNGEFLTPQVCRHLSEAGLMGAFVSIDCANAQRHDAFRRRNGLHAKALTGLANLRGAGLLAGISTHLSASRMAENAFEEMMELGRAYGAHEVTFFDAIPSGRWLLNDMDLLQPEHRLQIARLVKEYRQRADFPAISAQSTLTSVCGSAFCFAANTQFYLSASGDMCPCDFTPLSIGRFPEHSIESLWKAMTSTPPYHERAKSCRMQDASFRTQVLLPFVERDCPAPFPLRQVKAFDSPSAQRL